MMFSISSTVGRHIQWPVLAVFALVLSASACSDSSTGVQPQPTVTSVVVAPTQIGLNVGDHHDFSVRALDANGGEITGHPVTWSSTDLAVATVDATGSVTAIGIGATTIRATVDGIVGHGEVVVALAPVASITVDPTQATLTVGDTRAITVELKDALGRVVNGHPVTFATSDASRATVTAQGIVSAVSAGPVNITATADGKSAVAQLQIAPAPVASVELSDATVTLAVGASQVVTATAKDAAGRVLDGRAVTWTSSDPTVVTVEATGRIAAVRVGKADVTATIEGRSASLVATVTTIPVASVSVTPGAIVLEIGETKQMFAVVKDAQDRVLQGRTIRWGVVGDGARISPTGLVTGVRNGYVTITATSEGRQGAVTGTIVEPAPYAYDLLYSRFTNANMSELFTLSLSGAAVPERINAGSVSRHPTSSPSGSRIAFAVSMNDLNGARVDDIFAVDRDGLNMRRLTDEFGWDDQPEWSPIGGRIVYHHGEPEGRSDIWAMNEDGSAKVNLTSDLPAQATRSAPAWSPDGARIAFSQTQTLANGTETSIWSMRADGSDKRRHSATLTGFDGAPVWSPDGQRLAFTRYFGTELDIVLFTIATGAIQRIELPRHQWSPAWSPDGQYIAYVQEDGPVPGIYTMRTDGSSIRLRTVDLAWGGGLDPSWIRKR